MKPELHLSLGRSPVFTPGAIRVSPSSPEFRRRQHGRSTVIRLVVATLLAVVLVFGFAVPVAADTHPAPTGLALGRSLSAGLTLESRTGDSRPRSALLEGMASNISRTVACP